MSEVLGLAWEDLDLQAGTARIRRAAAYHPVGGGHGAAVPQTLGGASAACERSRALDSCRGSAVGLVAKATTVMYAPDV